MQTLVSAQCLADELALLGEHRVAEQMYRKAFDGGKKVLGPEHHFTKNSADGLVRLLERRGKAWEANQIYRMAYLSENLVSILFSKVSTRAH